ncbi:MAG: flagellar export protein FliJ [Pseudomonadales bacterium]|mgnify:CR=1 FL=1|jgi:flagellar protein FliJ|uniref:flagellar export protein FliJ n=1 Tax=unclassified Ketobacter TaxID=2639109 RepID=UPI000C524B11|nr:MULTISPECIES: flagellar export protein FliJ [unclassified Ketobacter]MAQ24973.1 flagellar export protein FliJ [Pseudomonadales bacterium]MEC8810564.1 flagellar export protein FliJ [Pseudomonadota bacterium]TNC87151.1 MAG: flagellar export protein FliJ [Alcanivorax sp.]HAG96956.1 flagellar export protein FliJ [Gammaproteobacteria bacterium]MBI26823.1 flagellar export protein FliJ [Pseudomonadales bacterium]|tara:strand:- start:1320 stop:1757 length:438 start_codon:yes stop_codon:yes gene_type:complete
MKKSKRLVPVRQLKQQAERGEAKKLAGLQQELQQAKNQLAELESYLAEYYQTVQQHQSQVTQASQLGLYQAFISRLQQAIRHQSEMVQQRQAAVQAQTRKWIEANARLKTMDQLIEAARQQENLDESRREQKVQDDRPFRGNNGF